MTKPDDRMLTSEEAAILGAFTGTLLGPFSELHDYVETILGRPVWTHEMASKEVAAEIRKAALPDARKLFYNPDRGSV